MNNELLKFENVSYSLQGKQIVSHVNWSVRKGEQWVLIGPNGAGKSTLLKLIYGFIWPNDSGVIYRKGEEFVDLGELRKSIGLVSGDLIGRIPFGETVVETVISGKYAMFGLWERGDTSLSGDQKKALGIIKKLNIENLKGRETRTLSHGETQKVLLARALMSDPYLILLDEPLDGLDPGAQESFLDTLNQYIYEHEEPSFIYVTHHIHEIVRGFKKMLMIKNGKILHNGSLVKGMTSENISKLYDYPFELKRAGNRFQLSRRNKS